MDSLKADQVLQEKVRSLSNVEILTSTQTTKVVGNGEKLTALQLRNRESGEERALELDGVFVQIGLSANSQPFEELEKTRIGEIVIDAHCRTNIAGVYAAGDVSSVPYKQIIIAMGEGAKAALTAFDDRVRGII
jgi:alkyl hydroperoxide reductase subunit F